MTSTSFSNFVTEKYILVAKFAKLFESRYFTKTFFAVCVSKVQNSSRIDGITDSQVNCKIIDCAQDSHHNRDISKRVKRFWTEKEIGLLMRNDLHWCSLGRV